jgi:hypothetical protein
MPSRSQMDTPAMVTVVVLGIVLIVVSVPFLGGAGGGATEYAITWSEVEAGTESMATGGAGSEQSIELALDDTHPANAQIELTSCNDGATAPVQQPATISWELRWESQVETGTASCAQDGPFTVAIEPRPDVASADGTSASDAEQAAYEAAGGNETVTFSLTFSWSRPGSPGGLPLPQPAFSATVQLTVSQGLATANQPGLEAPR